MHAWVGHQSGPSSRKRCDGSGPPLTQQFSQEWTTYDVDDVAAGLQEFLICVEMFFAALAHAHSFPPRDYMDPAGGVPRGFKQNIRIMFDVTDVVDDVQGVVDDTVSTPSSIGLSTYVLPAIEYNHTCSCCCRDLASPFSSCPREDNDWHRCVKRVETGMRGMHLM